MPEFRCLLCEAERETQGPRRTCHNCQRAPSCKDAGQYLDKSATIFCPIGWIRMSNEAPQGTGTRNFRKNGSSIPFGKRGSHG